MPRWLQIVLSLVLFAAVMLAVRAVLHATVPGMVESASAQFGERAVLAGFLTALCTLGATAVWLHRREQLSRRR